MVKSKACSKETFDAAFQSGIDFDHACDPPAAAGDWFIHKFGELRSYHKDWLAVCDDKSAGPCRAVQLHIADENDFRDRDRRIAVYYVSEGVYQIDVFERDMPNPPEGDIMFISDAKIIALTPEDFRAREVNLANAAETITVTNPILTAYIIERMKADLTLNVQYLVAKDQPVQAPFSLRGFTAALAAIDVHVSKRGTE